METFWSLALSQVMLFLHPKITFSPEGTLKFGNPLSSVFRSLLSDREEVGGQTAWCESLGFLPCTVQSDHQLWPGCSNFTDKNGPCFTSWTYRQRRLACQLKVGLFSSNANKTEEAAVLVTCAILWVEIWVFTWGGISEQAASSCCRSNIILALILSIQRHVAMAFSDGLFDSWCSHSEKKKAVMSGNEHDTGQPAFLTFQKFVQQFRSRWSLLAHPCTPRKKRHRQGWNTTQL